MESKHRDAEGSILKTTVTRRTDRGRSRKEIVYTARVRMNEYDLAGNFVRQRSKKESCASHEDAVAARRRLREELKAEIETATTAKRRTVEPGVCLFEFLDFFTTKYVREAEFVDGKKKAGQKEPVRHTLRMLDSFRAFFGDIAVREIDYALVAAYKEHLEQEKYTRRIKTLMEPGEIWNGEIWKRGRQSFRVENIESSRKAATVHRYLAKLRRVLSVAVQRGMLSVNPFKQGDALILSAIEDVRDRYLTFDEEERLYKACEAPKRGHLKNVIIIAIDTFARENEFFSLLGSDVNFEGRFIQIREENAKTATTRSVPLTDRALAAFVELRGGRPAEEWYTSRVFQMKGVGTSWYNALREAGIEDLRFHDLRGTGITRMLDAGIPAPIVMKFSGHEQFETFKKYIKRDLNIMQDAAKAMSEMTRARQAALARDPRTQGTLVELDSCSYSVVTASEEFIS